MRTSPILLAALAASACQPAGTVPAGQDSASVTAGQAAHKPPADSKLRALEQLGSGEFARMDDQGPSCAFYLASIPQGAALAVSRPHFAWIKLDGELLQLNAQQSAASGPLGTASSYAGSEFTLTVEPKNPDRADSTAPRQIIPAQLAVRDSQGTVIFASAGNLRCAVQ